MNESAQRIVEKFATECNVTVPNWTVVDKAGEDYLAIDVGHINDIYARNLTKLKEDPAITGDFGDRIFLREKSPKVWLQSQESQILQRLLAQSLTVGRSTLESDFHQKFIPFLGGEERRIYSETNHIVFGRRGAGKSSLVLYACHQAQRNDLPFSWIAMQQYRGRTDLQIVPQVLYEIVDSIAMHPDAEPERVKRLMTLINSLEEKGMNLSREELNVKLPLFARDFLPFVRKKGHFYLCIDDIHLIHPSVQPAFLSALYSFTRGNGVHLKITAIENLTRLWDEKEKEGLQTPGDAQEIRLDYNLVDPARAYEHIAEILNSYVKYAGIPSVASLCDKDVLRRLIWLSAGVPRDALYIFNNGITKAIATGRKEVARMDINMATAESLSEKERYIAEDVTEDAELVRKIMDDVRDFCLKEIRFNAFLVHINNSDKYYQLIKKVSDLRFIHVLHPGITPFKAGEKYEAFMLDYAFYTGFRKAPSVREFKTRPESIPAKVLRQLKRYKYEERSMGW